MGHGVFSPRRLVLSLLGLVTLSGCGKPTLIPTPEAEPESTIECNVEPAPPPPGERPLAEMPPTPPLGVAGDDSIRDRYAPELGNTGYDIQQYRLALSIDPAAKQITATVAIT